MSAGGPIFVVKTPLLPQFRFEWHEGAKRVYCIRLGPPPLYGDIIATEVEDHGAAYRAVLTWTRGYREHQREAALRATTSAQHIPRPTRLLIAG